MRYKVTSDFLLSLNLSWNTLNRSLRKVAPSTEHAEINVLSVLFQGKTLKIISVSLAFLSLAEWPIFHFCGNVWSGSSEYD